MLAGPRLLQVAREARLLPLVRARPPVLLIRRLEHRRLLIVVCALEFGFDAGACEPKRLLSNERRLTIKLIALSRPAVNARHHR